MPFPNEHACRLRDPGGFIKGSFRRSSRKSEGKKYGVIQGRLKGKTALTDQSFRYPKDIWSVSTARKHCKRHDGKLFEPASKEIMMNREAKLGVELKDLDDEGAGLARIATLEVVDADGDFTKRGAFGEQHVLVLPTHQWGSVPLGKARVFEKGDGAFAEFQLNLETIIGKEWHAALKFDFAGGKSIQKWSYGFSVKESSFEERDDVGRVRVLEAIIVHEVSPVVVGSGVDTATVAVKASKSFEAQLDAVMTEIDDIAGRAASIMKLRMVEGRGLSTARLEQIAELKTRLDEIIEACREISPEEAGRLLARFEAIRTGRYTDS